MIDFFKAFYTDALKGNEYIETAVVTGVTRVAKESIFSGLNNLGVYTILRNDYSRYFGFTQDEVKTFLEYYSKGENIEAVKKYYDGYHFGREPYTIDIYNPWSITNYIKDGYLLSYWINTSGDSLIKNVAKNDIQNFVNACTPLIRGESIEIIADEFVTLQRVGRLEDIWTLLLHSGYLTVESHSIGRSYDVKIPNEEIKEYFTYLFIELLSDNSNYGRTVNLLELLFEDFEYFEEVLNDRTLRCVSSHDLWRERDYHNLLLGALFVNSNKKYEVISQRESGLGRPDILVIKRGTHQELDITYVFEMKYTKDASLIEDKLKEAKEQIENKKYAKTLAGEVILVPVVACDKKYHF